jgi:hypothetical protein
MPALSVLPAAAAAAEASVCVHALVSGVWVYYG